VTFPAFIIVVETIQKYIVLATAVVTLHNLSNLPAHNRRHGTLPAAGDSISDRSTCSGRK
jgi:hypothetical protein